jgi:mannose-6-phosphate isomerase-like protein (cupin superfamily)
MEIKDIVTCMANGPITFIDREDSARDITWDQHPKFKGVYLKHLIKGADTDGKFSCHMVKLDPYAVLDKHVHINEWELHEVIEGEGQFLLIEKQTPYYSGCIGIIPKGTNHKIVAGERGLILLAKFLPALL